MIEFIKTNKQLVLMLLLWVAVGMIVEEVDYLLIPICLVLLKSKNRHTEMIIGFSLILFLADNRHHGLRDFSYGIKDVALLLFALLFFLNSKQFYERSKIHVPFILFIVLSFFMISKNPEPLDSFARTVAFALILITLPNYFLKELNENGESFLRNLIWFHILFLLISLILVIPLSEWVIQRENGRFNGLLGSPNGIGTICTLTIILIAAARFHYAQLFSKQELRFIYLVLIAAVVLSSSRNCIFSILIFLFFLRFYKISYLSGFIIVIVTALVFQFINENLVGIISSLGLEKVFRVQHLNDGSGRVIAWAFAADEINRNFFLGRGFGYDKYYFDLHKGYLSLLGHQGGVHNSYLTLWMNTGLIGLLLFMIGYFRLFFKAAAINYIAIPAMFAITFSVTFESWLASSLSPFTISFLLILTLLLYPKHEPSTQENTVSVL